MEMVARDGRELRSMARAGFDDEDERHLCSQHADKQDCAGDDHHRERSVFHQEIAKRPRRPLGARRSFADAVRDRVRRHAADLLAHAIVRDRDERHQQHDTRRRQNQISKPHDVESWQLPFRAPYIEKSTSERSAPYETSYCRYEAAVARAAARIRARPSLQHAPTNNFRSAFYGSERTRPVPGRMAIAQASRAIAQNPRRTGA